MSRYKIVIEYKGTDYVGWQRQDNGKSIQETIENSIEKLTNEKIQVFGAGRTDSGVHALGQVAHFDINKKFSSDSIRDGLNNFLRSESISIIDAEEVTDDFHARFSAKKREYLYKIINRRAPLTIEKDLAWVLHKKLNLEKIKDAANFFIGKNNLNAFRSSHCQSKTTIKNIDKIEIIKKNEQIEINVQAKSFLHSQVRIMVGTLINVGEGKISPEYIKFIIKEAKRENAGPTAPAAGLYLLKVIY